MGHSRRTVTIPTNLKWVALIVIMPTLAVVGGWAIYILVATIAFVLILVAFNKIELKWHPWLLFAMGLALVWQTTLVSSYLVGTDIHLEYYFEQLTENTGHWNYTVPCAYNSAMGPAFFIPMACRWFGLEAIAIFKGIVPLMLAGVPVVLYYIFKKQSDSKQAFLAATFFIIVPVFFLEVSCLVRQEIAELFLVLCLMLVVIKIERLGKWRLPLILLAGLLVVVNHYSMWVVLMIFLGVMLLTSLVLKPLKIEQAISIKALALIFVVIGGMGLVFYQFTSSGVVLGKLTQILPVQLQGALVAVKDFVPQELWPHVSTIEKPPDIPVDMPYEPLMKTALGLDYGNVGVWGKAFRVLQYITQGLIVVGSVYTLYLFIKRRNRFNVQYLGMIAAGAGILILCVTLPIFSWTMNASRLYHAALIGLAPMFVVGGLLIFRHSRYLVLAVMIPYLIFTSGVVFEATRTVNIDVVNLPYSVSLSNYRLDLTGSFTKDDEVARDWLYENRVQPVYGDLHGCNFLYEKYGLDGVYSIKKQDKFPGDCYIFLRSRSVEDEVLVAWMGVGMRAFRPFSIEELGDREVLFTSGNATVLGPRRDSE